MSGIICSKSYSRVRICNWAECEAVFSSLHDSELAGVWYPHLKANFVAYFVQNYKLLDMEAKSLLILCYNLVYSWL